MNTEEYYNSTDIDPVFKLIAQNQKLKEWVRKNYSKHKCAYTPYRLSDASPGDVFDDGYECGMSWAAYELGEILGLELPKPDQSDDYDL